MEAPPTLRLPGNTKPLSVALDLVLDPNATAFTGVVTIEVEVLQPTRTLWLNAKDLTLTAVTLNGQVPRVIDVSSDFVGLEFKDPLPVGKATLRIAYEGSIDRDKAQGIYSTAEASGERYIYTFFEPLDARRAFPCFDQPDAKVPWRLTLHVKKSDIARANSPVQSEADEANGMKAVTFVESKPLPSYLVAFVVGPFEVIAAPDAGRFHTPLNFIVPKGRGAETRYAAEVTPQIVAYLEDYFGMAYPYGKLDVAVVPRYWGTMEHPGLVAMGQPITLIRPTEETTARKQFYADILAHELAHYWFGDYVTMKWWDDTWLNESMAQWMDTKITDRVDLSWGFARTRLDRAEDAMSADALTSAKPIREPVDSPDGIANAFDGSLTYNKGQTVLGMFEKWIGPPLFQRAIRKYLSGHAWGNATENDLLLELEPEVANALRTFIDQPGVPLVEAKRVCDNEMAIRFSQQRYAPRDVTLPAESWTIPICARYGDDQGESGETCTLLRGGSALVPIEAPRCPTWIMSNADAAGYYRSKYDKATLDAIFAAQPRLQDAELTSLMHDAAALVDSGDLSLSDALALLPNVAATKDRYLFNSSFAILHIARSIATDAQRVPYASYLRATFGKRARALGWTARKGESNDDEILRPELLRLVAVAGRDVDLQKEGRALALHWLQDRRFMDLDLAEVALTAGAKTNDPALFEAMLVAAKTSSDHEEKERLFASLGAFTDPALAARALALLIDHALDLHDTEGILFLQLEDSRTRDAAYTFFDAHYDDLRARLREDEAMWLFALPRSFCDETHVQAMAAALSPRASKVPGAPRTLDGALETARLCIAKAKLHGASLEAFLKNY